MRRDRFHVAKNRYKRSMKRITPAEHRRMPWKNGGGVTTEILLEPGDGDRFRYRVSIADVATDGPFSTFEGYDRHIFLLEGAGMTLDAGAHGTFVLTPFVPQSFSGDWPVHGTLASGPARDFNLMVDRSWARSELTVETTIDPLRVEADVCIVHVIDGALTLVAEGALEYSPSTTERLAIARLYARVSQSPRS